MDIIGFGLVVPGAVVLEGGCPWVAVFPVVLYLYEQRATYEPLPKRDHSEHQGDYPPLAAHAGSFLGLTALTALSRAGTQAARMPCFLGAEMQSPSPAGKATEREGAPPPRAAN